MVIVFLVTQFHGSVSRNDSGANQNSEGRYCRIWIERRLGAEAFTSESRDYFSKGVARVLGNLFHLCVNIVVDRDGCSHEASIGIDAQEGKLLRRSENGK
jgi:hypothetical protein